MKCYDKVDIMKDENGMENLLREFKILERLDHPNIVKLTEAFKEENTIYIVKELQTAGDLQKLMNETRGGFGEIRTTKILINTLLSVINYCHH